MKKLVKMLCVMLCLVLCLAGSACTVNGGSNNGNGGNGGNNSGNGGGDPVGELKELDAIQSYNNIRSSVMPTGSCHDPAIIKADGNYYLFGTNSTTKFSSNNLITWNWQGQVFSYEPSYAINGVYTERTDSKGVVTSCAKEMVDYVMQYYGATPQFGETSGYWAPDIIKYNNEYRLYFCISLFGIKQSAIGFATSNSINGPFVYKGMVIKSSASDPQTLPNAIDPAIIVDKEGRMWMSYGSFFGGIYIIELDPATGFVKNGSGYQKAVSVRDNAGTKICAGSCEGPYIIYNLTTDYYYLFVSYGDLNKNYNVRVGRSKSVTGPYTYGFEDGLQMQKSGGNENNHGNKVLGGYNFAFEESVARMAPGHCSILNDNGNYYMVNHVRNRGDSLRHYVQIHKILFNEKGWPCVLANTYAGETIQNVGTSNLVGSWNAINFLKTDFTMNNGADNTQRALTMNIDGEKKVSGCFKGTVQMYEGGRIRLNITTNDFMDDEEPFLGTYYGYAIPAYDYDNYKSTLFISAVNDYGYTIVAEKA